MMNKKFDFRTSAYFPTAVYFGGLLLASSGLIFIFANLTAGIFFLMIGLIILTTSYRLEIDLEKKMYKEYVWFLGMKNGEPERFENIEYLFIKRSKQSQRMNSLVTSRTFAKDTFDGYLKFSESNKIHLSTTESKNDLMKKLNKIAVALNIKIIDYSE